ncbi:MAG TPA: hypothetical protein VL240_03395 [Candidatus Binatia bacterium]|nr:hypothetical protein [Candidatus Binatia bacterium]
MFEEILQGRYEQWQGLAPHLTLEDLSRWLAPAVLHPPRQRDRIATRYSVVQIERRSAPCLWEAWIPFASHEVAIVEVEDPLCSDIDATLEAMGKPETVLDDQRLSADYLVREFVFPQRGINLSVGDPLPSVSERRALLHVRLFPAMTLQRYLTAVGEPNPTTPQTNA